MRQNQLRAILIFLLTPTTTWQFAAYPYTTGTRRAAKISEKIHFQLGTPYLHRINECLTAISLFANSCHHITTNGLALPHPHKNQQQPTISLFHSDEGLIEKSSFLIFHVGNSTEIFMLDLKNDAKGLEFEITE